jgi:hypothetical protein
MGELWAASVAWFQGKKTILGGSLVIAGAAAGVWYGKLDPASALTVAGVGLSIAGFGAKANRHQSELLAALQGISEAGADVRAGRPGALAADVEVMAGQLAPAAAGLAGGISSVPPEQLEQLAALVADKLKAAGERSIPLGGHVS